MAKDPRAALRALLCELLDADSLPPGRAQQVEPVLRMAGDALDRDDVAALVEAVEHLELIMDLRVVPIGSEEPSAAATEPPDYREKATDLVQRLGLPESGERGSGRR